MSNHEIIAGLLAHVLGYRPSFFGLLALSSWVSKGMEYTYSILFPGRFANNVQYLRRDRPRRKNSSLETRHREIRANRSTTQNSHRLLDMAIPNPGWTRRLQSRHPDLLLSALTAAFNISTTIICL